MIRSHLLPGILISGFVFIVSIYFGSELPGAGPTFLALVMLCGVIVTCTSLLIASIEKEDSH